jgi:hypothetical protein
VAFQGVVTEATQFVLSGGSTIIAQQMTLVVQQNANGGNPISFSDNVLWSGGNTPTVPTAPDSASLFLFIPFGASGQYIGAYLGSATNATDTSLSVAALTTFIQSLPTVPPSEAGALWNNSGILTITDGGTPDEFSSGPFNGPNLISLLLSLPVATLGTPPPTAEGALYTTGGQLLITQGGTPGSYTNGTLSVANMTLLMLSLPTTDPSTSGVLWLNSGQLELS